MITESEKQVIKDEIKDNDIVFDIGFYIGEWSTEVFKNHDCTIYGFEAIKNIKFPNSFLNKRFTLFDDLVIFDKNGSIPFYVYLDKPYLSTVYKRIDEEWPNRLMKQCLTLDFICRKHEIKKIDFLKINTGGSEFDILKGCQELFEKNKIDKIQFNLEKNIDNTPYWFNRIINYLKQYGFNIFYNMDNSIEDDILGNYICKR